MVFYGAGSIEEGHLVYPFRGNQEAIIIYIWAKQVSPSKMLSFSLQEPRRPLLPMECKKVM